MTKKDDHILCKKGSLAGMTHKQILAQAKKDDKAQKGRKDPIAHAHKMSKGSPMSMFKKSMAHLDKLTKKKK